VVLKLLVEYDGKDFAGWQVQPKLRTVQGELIKSVDNFLRKPFRLIGASRTDKGVHAEGQVVSLHTSEEIKMKKEEFRRALNAILPKDIYIKEVTEEKEDFHARFSAKSKVYRYRLIKGRSPLRRNHVWEYPYDFDENKLREASDLLVGTHDFHTLSVGTGKGKGDVNVKKAYWKKSGDEWHFYIEANRFLYKMVRILIGLMMRIASGKASIEDLERALEGERRPRIIVAPPHGLTLLKIRY